MWREFLWLDRRGPQRVATSDKWQGSCKKAVTRNEGGTLIVLSNHFYVSCCSGKSTSRNKLIKIWRTSFQLFSQASNAITSRRCFRITRNSANQEWHVSFVIPELDVFPTHVLQAINTGVVTGSARREIVQIIRTYVLAHTCNPKSEHYNTVCRKLVDKYPKLQDTEGDSRYVSTAIKFQLMHIFIT